MKKINLYNTDEFVYYEVAECGLPIYIWQNKTKFGFNLSLCVKYGSIDVDYYSDGIEKHDPYGIAHYLEHLKFNEKDGTCANDFFESLGLYSNACTSFNYTNYEVSGTTNFDEALKHLLDFVYEPYFTDDLIEKERGIIIEEAKMGLDNPYNKLFYDALNNTFTDYNFKHEVIGTIDSIKSISKNDILSAYSTFYQPSNMFLIVTGNVDAKNIVNIVNETMSSKKIENKKIDRINQKEKANVFKCLNTLHGNINIPKVKINVKIPNNDFKDIPVVELIAILKVIVHSNFDLISEFNEQIINDRLVEVMVSGVCKYQDYSLIEITFETEHPDEAANRVIDKLNNLSITEEDLSRSIKDIESHLILSFDSMESFDYNIQKYILNYGSIIDNEIEIIENINVEKCKQVLNKIDFSKDKISITKMLPNE